MDNDKFEQQDVEEKSSRYQQFDPERFFEPPRMQRPSGPPNMTGMPTSAPPNFVPQMPREGGQPFSEFRNEMEFGRGGPSQDRGFRRCINRFTFIWLINGNSFWFYPTRMRRNQIEGFRWRNNRWIYDRINVRRILFFRCF